jgi:hypothetical protein
MDARICPRNLNTPFKYKVNFLCKLFHFCLVFFII